MSPIDLSTPYSRAPTLRQLWRWLVESVWSVEHAYERSKAKERPADDATLRIFLLLALFCLAFAWVGVSAARVTLFAKVHAGVGAAEPTGARATIEDRHGLIMAVDVPSYDLYLEPRQVAPMRQDEVRDALLTALPRLKAEHIGEAFTSDKRTLLASGLTLAEKTAVHDLGKPGVDFVEAPRRFYPLGATAAHVIGYTQSRGDGVAGAERGLDQEIQDGGAAGQPVQLSIDLRIQSALEDELAAAMEHFAPEDAAGIVVDVHTGEILAMVSLPAVDPLAMRMAATEAIRTHAALPETVTNHVAGVDYEAGSVFKVFTLAAALDTGAVNTSSSFDVSHPLVIGQNHPIHDFDKGDTLLTLPEVFTHSSNIGASRIALSVGADRMDRYMRGFGIYAAAPSELRESTRPLQPHRGPDGRLDEGVLAYMSFGQGLSVTPLQIATGMTSIFNGGDYIPLTIQKRTAAPQPLRRVISEKTAQTMLALMRLNVTDPKGSGKKADVAGLNVGGKTGTAQKAGQHGYVEGARVASFAAVFPATGALTDKRYLVYVLLDNPHPAADTAGFATAGFTAAPTAGAVINRIAPFLGVQRVLPAPGATVAGAPAKPAAPKPTSVGAD